jgi:two-component system, NarL family, nitrate/nitrite response regulator NarL
MAVRDVTAPPIKMIVIDDHPLMRRGIAETLSGEGDIEVVALGGSAEEAVVLARKHAPDVILIDALMPGSGIDATRRICAELRDAKVIMFSIRDDYETVQTALKAGARGYLHKGTAATDLIDAVRKVAAGGSYVSPELAARLLVDALSGEAAAGAPSMGLPSGSLTKREQQMLQLVGQGLSNQEIADRLGLAENTVKHQLTPLFRKLGVRNRTEAALLAASRPAGTDAVNG